MKNKLLKVLLVYLVFVPSLQAQKNYNIWYFGLNSGLDFNYSPAKALTSMPINTIEGSSTICDNSGNILFSSNGDIILNRNNQTMQGFSNSRQRSIFSSSVQACMAVGVPGSSNLYYLFVNSSFENRINYNDSFLYYYLIDMNGDGGLGEVIENEVKILKSTFENFAITSDSTGNELWAVSNYAPPNSLNLTKTINGKFTGKVIEYPLNMKEVGSWNLKFSPNSTILAGPCEYNYSTRASSLKLFRFNNSTGELSGRISINLNGLGGSYLEFSPGSRFLYVNCTDTSGVMVYQYDLSIWDSAKISESKVVITKLKPMSSIQGLQIGPDSKIYVFIYSSDPNSPYTIAVIGHPDLKGLRCNFNSYNYKLRLNNGGPYYPSYKFRGNVIDLGPDTVLCFGDSIRLFSYAGRGDKTRWNTGDTSAYLMVKKPGLYYVTVTMEDNFKMYGSIKIDFGSKPRVYIGNDTVFCHQFDYRLKAQKYFKNYKWSTGDTVYSISVNQEGIYSVTVKDSINCQSADTIALKRIKSPIINFSFDSVDCIYTTFKVDSIPEVYCVWNTNDTGFSIRTGLKGIYSVTAYSAFCQVSDTLTLDRLSMPLAELSEDTFMCAEPINLTAEDSGSFSWNTGENTRSIRISKPGRYWVEIERNHCKSSDTIQVNQDLPIFDLGKEIYSCDTFVTIGSNVKGKHLWNTGDTTEFIRVYKGRYTLLITRKKCTVSDSVKVIQLDVPHVYLGKDTQLCFNQLKLTSNSKGQFSWNNGANTPSLLISVPGIYSLTVSNGQCKSSDTIEILPCKRLTYFIPDAFSPNSNSINEIFKVSGDGIRNVELQIYNLWGELIRMDTGKDPYWDGTFNGKDCQQDVYVYKVKIEGFRPEDVYYLYGTVNLLR